MSLCFMSLLVHAGSPKGYRILHKLDTLQHLGHVEKKIARILKKIGNVPGLSEAERFLFARSLAATPDERWRLHENFLRSHGLFTRSSRRKFGFSSSA
jgi:hypothetical protein